MKKILLLWLALLLISSSASAQYIGLFTSDEHCWWCVHDLFWVPVEMWIICLPGPSGQICAEFMVDYPDNVIQSTVTRNDDIIGPELGDLASGIGVCYVHCQYNWHWNYHQTLYVTDDTKTRCDIVPHPDLGVYQFTNCNPSGYELEPCKILTHFLLNYEPGVDPECDYFATEESSWGAIKGIFSDQR
jgi:hypothetical protein